MFIVIEGPNGVGKTSQVRSITSVLRDRGLEVLTTTEPTNTRLGQLLRRGEDNIVGRGLALGIAADRWTHLEQEILPALEAGVIVISDRYVQSSLVLQRFDGLSVDDIWRYNDFVLPPDLTLYLRDDAKTIADRLSRRTHVSRLERVGTPDLELLYYQEAFVLLSDRGWVQEEIDCRELTESEVTARALSRVDALTRLAYK